VAPSRVLLIIETLVLKATDLHLTTMIVFEVIAAHRPCLGGDADRGDLLGRALGQRQPLGPNLSTEAAWGLGRSDGKPTACGPS
jgi:hypothetical protein